MAPLQRGPYILIKKPEAYYRKAQNFMIIKFFFKKRVVYYISHQRALVLVVLKSHIAIFSTTNTEKHVAMVVPQLKIFSFLLLIF